LEKSGASVDECIVYKTEYTDVNSADALHDMLEGRDIDLMTFFSPSSVESFFRSMRQIFPEPDSLSRVLSGIHTAVIGMVTSDALRKEGITPTIIPPLSTAESLIDSIVRLYTV
jgi:uroporphyrinogen-III synthase